MVAMDFLNTASMRVGRVLAHKGLVVTQRKEREIYDVTSMLGLYINNLGA